MMLAPYGQLPGGRWPTGVNYSYGPNGTYLGPHDPRHHERGEYGLYPDTMLGATRKPTLAQRIKRSFGLGNSIPTDDDLSTAYGYTPFNSGWVATAGGDYPGQWVPPNGYQPGWPMHFTPGVAGLGNVPEPGIIPMQATPNDLIMALNEHNQRMFTLAVVSTVIAGVAAMVTLYRVTKGLKND